MDRSTPHWRRAAFLRRGDWRTLSHVPRIRLLPDGLINRIAAGEVVERPAAVVKELVENSLDAGAGSVSVRLRDGGIGAVAVSDDGCGMDADDALLALERHATSKLSEHSKLDAITTLGFRGEALPSIAAVSRLTLETAVADGEGTRVECEFGHIRDVRPIARARGTDIRAADLFERLPARRKFLRSHETELRHAVALLTSLALTRPTTAFLLTHNDRKMLQLPPARDLSARLSDVLGAKKAQEVTPVSHHDGSIRITGYLLTSNKSARQVMLAVNGRVVRDRFLNAVAHRALRGASGAFEADGFLHLEMPAALVDVNVHPTKAEVRFVDPGAVAGALTAALATSLVRLRRPTEIRRLVTVPANAAHQPALPLSYPLPAPPFRVAEATVALQPTSVTATPFGRLLGQYRGTYLVVEDSEGLLIVDQHVAHERVLYEELLARSEETPMQPLLIPIVVELRAEQAALATEVAPTLASLGLQLEPLSGTSVRVLAAPAGVAPTLLHDALPAILADLEAGAAPGEAIRQRAAAALACRAAIKKNDPLARLEAEDLLARLARAADPHRCPHGRPIALRLPHAEIERRIGRT